MKSRLRRNSASSRPGVRLIALASQKADGGGEIGESSGADVDLHEGPLQRGLGVRLAAETLLDCPRKDTTTAG